MQHVRSVILVVAVAVSVVLLLSPESPKGASTSPLATEAATSSLQTSEPHGAAVEAESVPTAPTNSTEPLLDNSTAAAPLNATETPAPNRAVSLLRRVPQPPPRLAICFYGRWRENAPPTKKPSLGIHEEVWAVNKAMLAGLGVPYKVFVSTWDSVKPFTGRKFEAKLERDRKRNWFGHGSTATLDLNATILRTFGLDSLGGYYIGDHKGSVSNCTLMNCVVSHVRANCLKAIEAAEEEEGGVYPAVLLTRVETPMTLPLRVTTACMEPNRSLAQELARSQNPQHKCAFHFGRCRTYYRKSMWDPTAELDNNTIVTHVALSRRFSAKENARQGARVLSGAAYWKWFSDQGIGGLRQPVERYLNAVLERSQPEFVRASTTNGKTRISEYMEARAAEAVGLNVVPINFGLSGAPLINPLTGLVDADNTTLFPHKWITRDPDCAAGFTPKYMMDSCLPDYNTSSSTPDVNRTQVNFTAPVFASAVDRSCCTTVAECLRVHEAHRRAAAKVQKFK